VGSGVMRSGWKDKGDVWQQTLFASTFNSILVLFGLVPMYINRKLFGIFDIMFQQSEDCGSSCFCCVHTSGPRNRWKVCTLPLTIEPSLVSLFNETSDPQLLSPFHSLVLHLRHCSRSYEVSISIPHFSICLSSLKRKSHRPTTAVFATSVLPLPWPHPWSQPIDKSLLLILRPFEFSFCKAWLRLCCPILRRKKKKD
jgi:hypothetical protein